MKTRHIWVTGVFLASSVLHAGGRLVYSARGNLDFQEGTIEMWLKPGFEPSQSAPEYRVILPLFQLSDEEGNKNISISYACVSGGKKACWYIGGDCGGEKVFRLSASPEGWQKDQWHHLAFTWKGNTARIYLDGKLAGEAKSNRPLQGEVKAGQIFIGDRWTADKIKTEVVIDELRISNIERKPEELGCFSSGPLKSDPFTLLLENFETLSEGEKTQTCPLIISGCSSEKGGDVSGGRQAAGKFGYGLSLQ